MKQLAILWLLNALTPFAFAQEPGIDELEIPTIKPGLIDERSLSTGDVVPSVTEHEELPIIYYFGTLYREDDKIFLKRIKTGGLGIGIYRVENESFVRPELLGKRIVYSGAHKGSGSSEMSKVTISKLKDISGSFSIPTFWCSGVAIEGPGSDFKSFESHSMFLLKENVYDAETGESYNVTTYWQYHHGKSVKGIDRYSERYLQFPVIKEKWPGFSAVDTDGELATFGPAPKGGLMQRISGAWQLQFNEYVFHRMPGSMTCIAAGGRIPK